MFEKVLACLYFKWVDLFCLPGRATHVSSFFDGEEDLDLKSPITKQSMITGEWVWLGSNIIKIILHQDPH